MDKLSFNKRVSLVKKEVFDLIQADDLNKGTGCGYYSIKTIMSNLNKVMDKYDVDLDINLVGELARCTWIDCLSDAIRSIDIDLRPISDIEKLPMMQNIIQSQGSVITYYRRYAITNCLNLNATDLIENGTPNQAQSTPRKSSEAKTDDENKKTARLMNILYLVANKDKGKTIELLQDLSSFTGKDGKVVPGIADFESLKGQRLNVTLKKVEGLYVEEVKKVDEKAKNKGA